MHNANNGLPPHVHEKILELEETYSGIKIELWGLEELKDIFRTLEKIDLVSWLGPVPNAQTKQNIGFEDIRVVLESIEIKEPDPTIPVKPVPPQKIEANQLSDSIFKLLKGGFSKASLVKDFFDKWHDPKFGEKIATSFHQKYKELCKNRNPNAIFLELQAWLGGCERQKPEREMAILTVIAYYFERCDIYEEPRD